MSTNRVLVVKPGWNAFENTRVWFYAQGGRSHVMQHHAHSLPNQSRFFDEIPRSSPISRNTKVRQICDIFPSAERRPVRRIATIIARAGTNMRWFAGLVHSDCLSCASAAFRVAGSVCTPAVSVWYHRVATFCTVGTWTLRRCQHSPQNSSVHVGFWEDRRQERRDACGRPKREC